MNDLVKDFFDPSKPFKKLEPRRIPCGGSDNLSLSSRNVVDQEPMDISQDRDFENNDAIQSFRAEEEEIYRRKYSEISSERNVSSLDDAEHLETPENNVDYFASYKNTTRIEREPLLIDHYQQRILNMLDTVGVIVIQGPTGCGKSTQVPQFILNDIMYKGVKGPKIVVTQPRRIAAISVAQRVAQERKWTLGDMVGYKVSLEQKVNEETSLLYCTTGVLLRRLIATKSVSEYAYIILDEVHERDQEMDFLLLTVRKLRANHPKTKVILMSATIDSVKFANYFKILQGTKMVPCPIIDVKKEQMYRTDIFYLNQMTAIVSNLGGLNFDLTMPKFENSLVKVCARLICIFDKLDAGTKGNQNIGSVLVFAPGMHEIEELYKELKESATRDRKEALTEWKILPLHSSITIEEQRRIFDPVEKNVRKIILSTNIAESSLTVPNIGYVIDFCLTKALVYNRDSKFTSLQLNWASKANLDQRAGRTGRVCNGRVYRLITEDLFQQLSDSAIPEILRCPLDRLVLMAKMLGMGPPRQILSLALDPPDLHNLRKTILFLREAGALISRKVTDFDDDGLNAEITFLGKVMADLPLDIHCTKLIVLGYIFDLLEEAIVIATAISIKSVFSVPFDARLKAYMWKLSWADGSCSDLIAFYNVYRYSKFVDTSRRNPNRPTDFSWARRLFLQKNVLKEWNSLIEEVKGRLSRHNLTKKDAFSSHQVLDNERMIMLKVIIAGAFYPNYFYRQGQPTLEKDAVRALNNCDPFTSVYLSGLDQDQPKELYTKCIKNLFKDCANEMDVFFDQSKKIFVQFRKSTDIESISIGTLMLQAFVPGKVANEVYRAVRMRQLRIPFDIKVMNAVEANKRMQLIRSQSAGGRYGSTNQDTFTKKTFLPKMDDYQIKIRTAHIIDPGHFFAHYCDDYIAKLLKHVFALLNDNIQTLPPLMEKVKLNGLYAALFEEPTYCGYYRARVISVDTPVNQCENVLKVKVQFIDYGNIATVDASDLRTLPTEALTYEPIAIECRLAHIKPSKYINDRNTWTKMAIEWFVNATHNTDLTGKVYSVVNRVVNIELYRVGDYVTSINKFLVASDFAVDCEEDYLSKCNFEERKRYSGQPDENDALRSTTYNEINFDEIEPPSENECVRRVMLKGPFSPLEIKLMAFMDGIHDVSIDQNSVNAVLLDTEPSDVFDRLYVASSISENRSGSVLNLRYLTAMPSVPGFMAMMGMIFTPYMSVKRSQNRTRIGHVVCGLGHDLNFKSLIPEHDLVMNLDVEFDMEDLEAVNNIRYYINRVMENLDNSEIDEVLFHRSREKIKSNFLKLLKRKRAYCAKEQLLSEYKWMGLPDEIVLKANADDGTTVNYVWPLHKGVRLNRKTHEVILTDNVEYLKKVARGEFENVSFPIECMVCHENLFDQTHIRDHIVRSTHIDAMERLNYNK